MNRFGQKVKIGFWTRGNGWEEKRSWISQREGKKKGGGGRRGKDD